MFSLFGRSNEPTDIAFNSPYALTMKSKDFVNFKTWNLCRRILTRCFNKSEGIKDNKQIASLFDSIEQSNAENGLLSIVAKAMTDKSQKFIVYDSGIVREATTKEADQIRKDYAEKAQSDVGIYINFQKYSLTDLIKMYMNMVYGVMDSANTEVSLARALQIKISKMRELVSTNAMVEPTKQAAMINEGLKQGKSVMIDAADNIEQPKLNSEPIKSSLMLIYSELAAELGMPLSFISGELASGMAVTGEADANAIEAGLKDFFVSVFKPIVDKLYKVDVVFKSDNWRLVKEYAQSLVYVENSTILSEEQKEAFADYLIPVSDNEK